ncbi:MAG: NHL repeat-containing protein [Chloroflexota bacterium]|nr:NHL repeat-containing protein [Chloroflexota bacterium]MDE2920273.1 NHL repeat-containing protein [Chloroflexota bacterium]
MRPFTRRRVLKTGLAGAVLLATWPAAVGAEVAVEFLPNLEQGAGSAPWGVAIGPDGLIYVTDSRLHQLAAQSPDGGIVRVLAESGSGPGQVRRPQGVVVSPDGEVYVVDGGNRRVQVFDLEGELLRRWGRHGSDPGEFSAPRGIALDAFGDVYVADGFNDRIQKFDREGEFLLAWGSRGRTPGQFSTPTGIAIGASQTVYVADTFRDRVQAFETDGSFVEMVVEAPDVRNPIGLAVDTGDRLYISTDVDHGLVVVENDGATAGTIGSEGDEDGQFQFPRSVAVDETGRTYVADSLNHRVQTFRTGLEQFTPPTEAADLAIGVAARTPLTSATEHNLTNWLVRLDGQLRVVPFAAYFTATGGIDRWGWPISEPLLESSGTITQYFQRGVMDWTADAEGRRAMLPRPVWDFLGGGRGGAPDLGTEPDVLSDQPGVLVGTWGHRVSDFAVDGTEVGFLEFFNTYGGEAQFGAPRTEARPDTGAAGTLYTDDAPSGVIRQYFQNAVFEYAPNRPQPVRLRLIGQSLRDRLYPAWSGHPTFADQAAVEPGQSVDIPDLSA